MTRTEMFLAIDDQANRLELEVQKLSTLSILLEAIGTENYNMVSVEEFKGMGSILCDIAYHLREIHEGLSPLAEILKEKPTICN